MKLWSAAVLLVMITASSARADDVAVGEIVNRIGVHAQVGDGWNARYSGGSRASRALSGGLGVDLVAGVDNFGIAIGAGVLYDKGTSPEPGVQPVDKLWMIDLGAGLEAAPYAPIRRPHFELRLHLGGRAAMLVRRGCDDGRCGPKLEPDLGFALEFTTGVIMWWGARRENGMAIDAVFMRGKMGDLMPRATDALTNAELRPPLFMMRATWMLFRGKHDQKKKTPTTAPTTPMTEPTPLNGPRVPTR
jgi:hypothetical protein